MFSKKVVTSSIIAAALVLSFAQPAFAEPTDKDVRAAEHESWLTWIMSAHGTDLNSIWRSMIGA